MNAGRHPVRWLAVLALLGAVAVFVLLDRSPEGVVEAVPQVGNAFSGTVSVGGLPAAGGVEIQAKIGGINFAFSNQGGHIPRTAPDGTYGQNYQGQPNTFQVLEDDFDTVGVKEGGGGTENSSHSS
jgi:hypothetical protein